MIFFTYLALLIFDCLRPLGLRNLAVVAVVTVYYWLQSPSHVCNRKMTSFIRVVMAQSKSYMYLMSIFLLVLFARIGAVT